MNYGRYLQNRTSVRWFIYCILLMKDFSVFRWLLRQLAVCIAPSLTGLVLLATASPAGAQIPSFATVAPYGSGTSGTGPGSPKAWRWWT